MPPTPPAMKALEPPADLTSSSLNSLAPSTIVSLSSIALCLSSAAFGGVGVDVVMLLSDGREVAEGGWAGGSGLSANGFQTR